MHHVTWHGIRVFGLIAALAGVVSAGACSDDGGSSNPQGDASVDAQSPGDAGRDSGQDGGQDDADVSPLAVSQVSPEADATDIPIDQTIRVVFTRNLDARTVTEESVQVTADGEPVTGRIVCNHKVVLFAPGQLPPETDVTVTLRGAIRDEDGLELGQDYEFSFTTGATDSNLRPPLDVAAVAPFKDRRFIHFTRAVEYVVLGADYDDSGNNVSVVDPLAFDSQDPPPTREVLYATRQPALGAQDQRIGRAGNFDDDPTDEVAVVTLPSSGPGRLLVLDRSSAGFSTQTLPVDLSTGSNPDAAYEYDLAVGDVDLDGYDEIVVVGRSSDGAKLWVIDDAKRGYAVMRRMNLLGENLQGGWSGMSHVRVAVGDFVTGLGKEIALIYRIPDSSALWLRIIHDMSDSYQGLETHNLMPDGPDQPFEITAADLDGDQVQDLAVAWKRTWTDYSSNYCHVELHAYPVFLSGDGQVQVGAEWNAEQLVRGFCEQRGLVTPGFVLRTLSNNLRALTDSNGVTNVDPSLFRDNLFIHGITVTKDASSMDLQTVDGQTVPFVADQGRQAPVAADVGDVNADHRQDIILLYPDSTIRVWGIQRVQVGTDDHGDPVFDFQWAELDERGGGLPDGYSNQIVVAADLDHDSIVGEAVPADPDNPDPTPGPEQYNVEHRIVFSDNQILGVIAAPPCREGIGQNLGACSTGLGITTTAGVTAGTSVSVFAGVSIGYEWSFTENAVFAGMEAFSLTLKMIAEIEATVYASMSVSVSHTITNYAGPGEDLVVFFTVPQHQFIYSIVSHPDPSMVGQKFYVNIPMTPRIMSVTRRYYNANNGIQADIGEDILPYWTGDLSRYPNATEMEQILETHVPLGPPLPLQNVPEGSGFQTQSLEVSVSGTVGASLTMKSTVEGEICVEGLCAGAWSGVSTSVYAEATMAQATTFTSSVGAIDEDHFAEYTFSYGLFAYLAGFTDDNGNPVQLFPVVNYYVGQ